MERCRAAPGNSRGAGVRGGGGAQGLVKGVRARQLRHAQQRLHAARQQARVRGPAARHVPRLVCCQELRVPPAPRRWPCCCWRPRSGAGLPCLAAASAWGARGRQARAFWGCGRRHGRGGGGQSRPGGAHGGRRVHEEAAEQVRGAPAHRHTHGIRVLVTHFAGRARTWPTTPCRAHTCWAAPAALAAERDAGGRLPAGCAGACAAAAPPPAQPAPLARRPLRALCPAARRRAGAAPGWWRSHAAAACRGW